MARFSVETETVCQPHISRSNNVSGDWPNHSLLRTRGLVFPRHAADVYLEAKSTMKLASPSFTGVLQVAVRTRVCGTETDCVHCCIKSVVACREEFGVLLFSSRFKSRCFGDSGTWGHSEL